MFMPFAISGSISIVAVIYVVYVLKRWKTYNTCSRLLLGGIMIFIGAALSLNWYIVLDLAATLYKTTIWGLAELAIDMFPYDTVKWVVLGAAGMMAIVVNHPLYGKCSKLHARLEFIQVKLDDVPLGSSFWHHGNLYYKSETQKNNSDKVAIYTRRKELVYLHERTRVEVFTLR